jgi:hypothetical protein
MFVDANEIEIVRVRGLEPIISGAQYAARELDDLSARSEREINQLEELATQCSRALRNLSVNRKFVAVLVKSYFIFPSSLE